MKLFGTDGIRGKYGSGFFDKSGLNVYLIGYAAASILKKRLGRPPHLIIGMDTRESSPIIGFNLSKGLKATCQAKVVLCGVFPTPAVAWLTKHKGFDSGIVISASHNPWQDNGIKFFSSTGEKLSDTIENEIEKEWLKISSDKKYINYFSSDQKLKKEHKPHRLSYRYKSDYIKYLLSTLSYSKENATSLSDFLKNFTLVIDCANGAASDFAGEVFDKLGAKVKLINNSPDGKNINDNCGSLHPEGCAKIVRQTRAFAGISFDGDADRVLFIDENGEVIDGDKIIAVCARYLKKINRLTDNPVVATVMSNLGFLDYMKSQGIKVAISAVGDRNVWEEMKKNRSILGGEQSGHIIFKEYATTGDGLLTALQFLNAIASDTRMRGKPLSAIATSLFKKYPQFILNLPVKEKIPIEDIPEFNKALRMEEKNLSGHGRIFVRYSGTEPLLRIMVEGPDDKVTYKVAQNLKEVYIKSVS